MATNRRAAPAAPRTPGRAAGAEPNAGALLDALRAVARELRVAEREAEQRVGLHPAQLHSLRQLALAPAASLAELAERTHTDPSSASVVVQRLVDRGLVARMEAADDRRRTQLEITAAGRALVARAPAASADRLGDAVGHLGAARTTTLVHGLRALSRALRAAEDAAGPG
jgi:DNA-binding MarR family transcriptional regulator